MKRFLLLAMLVVMMSSGPAWAVADEIMPPPFPFPNGNPQNIDTRTLTQAQRQAYIKWRYDYEKHLGRRMDARGVRLAKLAEQRELQERWQRQQRTPALPFYPDE